MSYTVAAQKLMDLPEEYLDEVVEYMDFLQFRRQNRLERTSGGDLSRFFGALKTLDDGLRMQRRMRDEWN